MTETFWAPEKYCYKQVEFTYYLEIFVSILLETWMWEWSFLFPFIHPWRRMYNQHWKPSCNSFSIQQPEGSFETRSWSMSLLCGLHLTQKKNWSPRWQPPSSIWSGQSVPLLYYFLLLLSVLWKTDFLAIPWTCKGRTRLRTFALAGFSHGVSFPQLPAWLSFPYVLQIFTGMFPS